MMRRAFLAFHQLLYARLARPLIFRSPPQQSHKQVLWWLRWLDDQRWTHPLLRWVHDLAFVERPLRVGGMTLHHPLILAAGFVKGQRSGNEATIPGWHSLPLLVGVVEFGSFTRWPREGNQGIVLWRDEATQSTQNRVGLKNPGAEAAAAFLARRRDHLPPIWGINIAVSPGVSDPDQECHEVLEAVGLFLDRGLRPSWFTLNLSCPNTEDDPGSHQTETRVRNLCAAVIERLQPVSIPLWVKISPALADEQYRVLLHAFEQAGVQAVIATNTLGALAPDGTTAGIGGGRLQASALAAVRQLHEEKVRCGYAIDIIGCGGVLDGQTYQEFARSGAAAMQYWSALVYRGPLAAAVIAQESEQ